ncbi:MAG: hypothetical protein KGH98_04215 [Candidatus Micrarchaeota archaeon]|nr:hypothetical protein [Candidatus Micrarchaeota archaeon]
MDSECDAALRLSVPAARAAVIRELHSKYGMSQIEISRRLGVTQASVSKCIKGKYSRNIALVCSMIMGKGLESNAVRAAAKSSVKRANEEIDRIASKSTVLGYAEKLLAKG